MKISKRNLKLLVENYLNESLEAKQAFPLGVAYLKGIASGKNKTINDKTNLSSEGPSQAIRYVQVLLNVVPSVDKAVANFGEGTKKGIISFQKQKGIAASGVIGISTAQAILNKTADVPDQGPEYGAGNDNDPGIGTLKIANSLNTLLDQNSTGWIEDLFVEGEIAYNNLAKLKEEGCAQWVNAWMKENSVGYVARQAAWLGYDPDKSSNFITNLNKSSPAQEKRFEKAFNLMCGTAGGMSSKEAEAIIDSLGSEMVLPSSIVNQIQPGHLVGLKYFSSSFLGQAAFEASIATAATEKSLAPDAGTRIRSQNFFKDENGDYFSRKKLNNGEYDFGQNAQKTPLKFVTGKGLIGLNTHIGVCIGKLTNTDGYTSPIIAHNVHNNLHVAVLDITASSAITKERYPSQVLWIDTTTKINGLKNRKFKNIGVN